MKKSKTLRLLLPLLMICVFLQGCESPLVAFRHPAPQSHSIWSTEDGSVVFCVGATEIDPIYGTIETSDGPVPIAITMSTLTDGVSFYYEEDKQNWDNDNIPESLADGFGKVISRKEYKIEITSADIFFESGQVLTFYRIYDGKSPIGTGDGSRPLKE